MRAGRAIRLRCDGPVRGRMVDDLCRVVDADSIAGARRASASGLPPASCRTGRLGGETSFRGQANGLWLWQNDVGRLIVEQHPRRRERDARARSARSHDDARAASSAS